MAELISSQDVRRGKVKPFNTKKGWTRKRVTFEPPFPEGTVPIFTFCIGEGSGSDNVRKDSIKYVGFESVTNKTATIAISDTATTRDVVINWITLP